MAKSPEHGWLLLIHQIPPKPPYLRAKISRRLQQIGAVPVKNSVYVLPGGAGRHEDFQWIAREIVKGKGEATICEARFVDGLNDDAVRRMFNDARDRDYRAVAEEVRASLRAPQADREAEASRLRQRLADLQEIDYFGALGRTAAEAAVRRLAGGKREAVPVEGRRLSTADYRGRTWVTRQGIYVDRIACAWLIRKVIDPKARFKYVPGKTYEPKAGELRFDMFEGEFTHEGENCSFETLLERFGIDDAALRALGEIVHDIDLKDRKYKREEATGIDRLLAGICMGNKADEDRLARGGAVFDDLVEYFRRKLG
jgi:hypothetical protein